MKSQNCVSLLGYAEYYDGSIMLTFVTIVSSLENHENWYKCLSGHAFKYANYSTAYEDCKNSGSAIQTYYNRHDMLNLIMDSNVRQQSKRHLRDTWGNSTMIFPNANNSGLVVEAFIWTGTTRSSVSELTDETGEIFFLGDFLETFGCDDFVTGNNFPVSVELTQNFSLTTLIYETRKRFQLEILFSTKNFRRITYVI